MEHPSTCPICGNAQPELPLCYGAEAPWRELGVSDEEFERRVELSPDQCVVDERYFFIRICLPGEWVSEWGWATEDVREDGEGIERTLLAGSEDAHQNGLSPCTGGTAIAT